MQTRKGEWLQGTAPITTEPIADNQLLSTEQSEGWHWCPDCHIASGKPGDCPTCAKAFLPAPPEGLPYGPYYPPTVRKRSKALLVMPLITIFAVAITGLFGVWLYRQGTPTASSSASSDGLVHTSAHTTVHLPELGTVNLPGTWVADPITQASLQANLNSQGGSGHVLAVERSGNTILWLASVVKFPTGGADPCTETQLGNGTPTIASHPAERTDLKSACSDGTTYSRTYDMKDTGADLVLKIISPASLSPLNSIESALLELPGSNAGGVTV